MVQQRELLFNSYINYNFYDKIFTILFYDLFRY